VSNGKVDTVTRPQTSTSETTIRPFRVNVPEEQLADLRRRIDATLAVPAITLEGDANGAFHPPASAYAGKFSGKYEHRVITGGIGHNLPQEAPQAFAQAILDFDLMAKE